jgi:hypothetical protein
MSPESYMFLCLRPRKGVATNQIINGISFREIMKLYIISASNLAI